MGKSAIDMLPVDGSGKDALLLNDGNKLLVCKMDGDAFECQSHVSDGNIFNLRTHEYGIDGNANELFTGNFFGGTAPAYGFYDVRDGFPNDVDTNKIHLCRQIISDPNKNCSDVFSDVSHDLLFVPETGLRVADINGDGNDDVLFHFRDSLYSCFGTGQGLDCKKMQSADEKKQIFGVGNFAGDQHSSILLREWVKRSSYGYDIKIVECSLNNSIVGCHPVEMPTIRTPTAARYMFFERVTGSDLPSIIFYEYTGGSEVSSWTVYPLESSLDGDRLVAVTDGRGNVSEVSYGSLADSQLYQPYDSQDGVPAYPLRSIRQGTVVKSLRRSQGAGGSTQTDYRYSGLMTDQQGRGSQGFRQVTATASGSGVVITTRYRQGFPYTGLVESAQSVSRTGQVLSREVIQYQARTQRFANGAQTWLPLPVNQHSENYDLDGSPMTATDTLIALDKVDDYGNVLHGETRRYALADPARVWVESVDSSYQNVPDRWSLGLVQRQVNSRAEPGQAPVSRTVAYGYDARDGVNVTVLEPDDVRYRLETTVSRDGFGNVLETRHGWQDPASGQTQQRLTQQLGYDVHGRFAVTQRNALGHTVTRGYDAASGQVTLITDANGLTTQWRVDGFGRVRQRHDPDGSDLLWTERQCQGGDCGGASAVVIQERFRAGQRSAAPVLSYLDNAGHVLKRLDWGFDGRLRVQEQRYDSEGRLWQRDRSRFDGDAPVLAAEYRYDDLARVVGVTTTSGTDSMTFHGLVREAVNAKQQRRTEQRDALGRVVLARDARGKSITLAYDAFSNLVRSQDPNGNLVQVSYDRLGRRTALIDPDLGERHYAVDPLGLVWQEDSPNLRAKGQSVRYRYDALGRQIQRLEPDLTSTWVYDSAPLGIGQLAESYTGSEANKDFRRQYRYDSYGRLQDVVTQLDTSYTDHTDYDALGRVQRISHQRGNDPAKSFEYRYNAQGYLERVDRQGAALWQVQQQDAEQHVLAARLGNGLISTRHYDGTGRMDSVQLLNGGTGLVQQGYAYDVLGNVMVKTLALGDQVSSETFGYDELNRLVSSQVAGQSAQAFGYDDAGNLLNKTGLGAYQYPAQGTGAARPHAMQRIDALGEFRYDDNGNLVSGAGRTLSWSSFDMPLHIQRGAASSDFSYGTEHQRTRQVKSDGTVVYYAGAMEVSLRNGQATVKTYWPLGLGMEIDRPGQGTEFNWLERDAQDSVIAISDASGTLKERLSYDAWGLRRNLNGSVATSPLAGQTDNRGYTDHEMLDELGLVHMNGRILDPLTGRVLSADPLVGDLQNGQGYNRYSYVENNPVNLSDPSGFAAVSPPMIIEQLPPVLVTATRYNPCSDTFSCGRFIQGLIRDAQQLQRAWRIAEPIMAARLERRMWQAAATHSIDAFAPPAAAATTPISLALTAVGIWEAGNGLYDAWKDAGADQGGDSDALAGGKDGTKSASGGAMPPDNENENQEKNYKRPNDKLDKGDQVDLGRFSKRTKVEGETRFEDPKSGYQISKDRAGGNSHGGSAWKLIDRAGERIGTLSSDGTFLRK